MAINERGERLLGIAAIGPEDARSVPVSFALVAATWDDRLLLVHNRCRGVWELPGGFIDHGESAEQCALRELIEESAQTDVRPLRWKALVSLAVPQTHPASYTTRHGAVFITDLRALSPFQANEEIDAIGFWPVDRPPPGTSAIDAALLAFLARPTRHPAD